MTALGRKLPLSRIPQADSRLTFTIRGGPHGVALEIVNFAMSAIEAMPNDGRGETFQFALPRDGSSTM
jgi:hypothetical protein